MKVKIEKIVEILPMIESEYYNKNLQDITLSIKDLPKHRQNQQFYSAKEGYKIVENGWETWISIQDFEKYYKII